MSLVHHTGRRTPGGDRPYRDVAPTPRAGRGGLQLLRDLTNGLRRHAGIPGATQEHRRVVRSNNWRTKGVVPSHREQRRSSGQQLLIRGGDEEGVGVEGEDRMQRVVV